MTIDPKVLARAQALKALAEGTDNPHEAELASMRLAEYLDRHRLDVAALSDGPARFGRAPYVLLGTKYLRASLALLTYVARHYGVIVLVPRTGNSKVPNLIGTEEDLAMTVLLFESLIVQRDRACVVDRVPYGVSTATHRNSFCYGYAVRINARLTELRDRQKSAAVDASDSKALELYNREDAVKRFIEEESGKSLNNATRNKPTLDPRGVVSGDHAARNADLGQTRVGNTDPQALEA